jgi:hypothetical protein
MNKRTVHGSHNTLFDRFSYDKQLGEYSNIMRPFNMTFYK